MPVVSLHSLGQSFGDFDVFLNLTASVHHNERVGLVGPNGIGKTTLLLLLSGHNQPSSGSVSMAKGTRLGYLPQEAMEAFEDDARTVFDEMLMVFTSLRGMEERLREMESTMETGDYSEALLRTYGELQEAFEKQGGYEYEAEIARVLRGLGFDDDRWDTPINHLSGGQKTRALLARLLLEKPDILLMDEPTNHLDVETVCWLEDALLRWEGAVLIVSHDRWFLDRVATTIWGMSRGGIDAYKGNYSAYVKQRRMRGDHHAEIFETEIERLKKELDFVKRNIVRASSNARAVGRLRRLSRQIIAIEQLGVMAVKDSKWSELDVDHVKVLGVQEAEQRLKALRGPERTHHRLNVGLKSAERSGEIILRAHGLCVGYPDAPLFEVDDLKLMRREVAALIGPNGSGKTTFLRTILGNHPPLSGELKHGAGLKIGYFAQARDELDDDNRVIDELLRHREMPISRARSYLAQYLFRQDDVFKPVSALSGGERGRLALAILALDEVNFLLLDEPTNHLDIPAQEVLQEVLEYFDGTILLVSHDRYLIDRLATQIWEIKDDQLEVFEGTYQQYLAAHGATVETMSLVAARQRQTASDNGGKGSREQKARRNEHRIAQLEAHIASMESVLAKLRQDLQVAGQGGRGYNRLQDISREYQAAQRQLDDLVAEWAVLAGE
ncbi:MAG: ABC-F family ATP-binding cassette domain-containing protein [Anaerolineae bacterium]|nr:ABC-F family ATP-binding cassette domain-containing protein [Anaerolineae bacterium]